MLLTGWMYRILPDSAFLYCVNNTLVVLEAAMDAWVTFELQTHSRISRTFTVFTGRSHLHLNFQVNTVSSLFVEEARLS